MSTPTKNTAKTPEGPTWAPMLLDAWLAPMRVLAWQQEQAEAVTLAYFERVHTVRHDGEKVYEAAAKRGVETLVAGEARFVDACKKMGVPVFGVEATASVA